MTMQERLRVHDEIEAANYEHLRSCMMARYYDDMTIKEVQRMLEDKDSRMEWDDEFGFLVNLLDSKLYNREVNY